MLLSFLNKDPISAAQQTGSNNTFVNPSMHISQSGATSNTRLDGVPARHCILPIMDKLQPRVNLIEQKCNRPLAVKEKERLNEIDQLLRPDGISSPLITREHLMLLSKPSFSCFARNWNDAFSFSNGQRH
jgi:hypothetical protein